MSAPRGSRPWALVGLLTVVLVAGLSGCGGAPSAASGSAQPVEQLTVTPQAQPAGTQHVDVRGVGLDVDPAWTTRTSAPTSDTTVLQVLDGSTVQLALEVSDSGGTDAGVERAALALPQLMRAQAGRTLSATTSLAVTWPGLSYAAGFQAVETRDLAVDDLRVVVAHDAAGRLITLQVWAAKGTLDSSAAWQAARTLVTG